MSTSIAAATDAGPKVEPLTCAIGAEVQNVHLGAAARDPGLSAKRPRIPSFLPG